MNGEWYDIACDHSPLTYSPLTSLEINLQAEISPVSPDIAFAPGEGAVGVAMHRRGDLVAVHRFPAQERENQLQPEVEAPA